MIGNYDTRGFWILLSGNELAGDEIVKKLLLIGILLSLLLIAMPAMAHTCDAPQTIDLLAGQTSNVGTVKVCNDDTNLYVTFTTTGTNFMRETHLAVATSLSGIPQTKKFNPIPGQFAYKTAHAPAVQTFTYTIPKTWATGTPLYIAAHASLDKADTLTFLSNDGKTRVIAEDGVPVTSYPAVLAWEPGPDYPNDGPVDSGWQANSLWDQQVNTPGLTNGADWVWKSYRVDDPKQIHSVTFANTFTVPGEPISATLLVADDNQYVASLNGATVGSQTDWNNWKLAGSYDIMPVIVAGPNTFQVVGTNYGDSSFPTASSNPAGLIFKGEVKYLVPSETAWGDGNDFAGANWATYFTYTVQGGCVPVGTTVHVPAKDAPVVTSVIPFENGKTYKVKASGTAYANTQIEFDAKYSFNNGDGGSSSTTWTDSVLNYESYGPQLLDLYVNGINVDWGPYSPSHVYEKEIVGTGTPATFKFQINDFYPENDYGELTVDICRVY